MAREKEPQIEKLVRRTREIAKETGKTQSQARRDAFRQLINEQAKGGNG